MTGCGTRLLVTGATGSLGGAVAARLAGDGHRVRGLVRFGPAPAGETVVADLTDRQAVFEAAKGVDVAVHCAAASGDLDECQRVNVEGTANLVAALAFEGCGLLVHISTVAVYDSSSGGTTFDEDHPMWTAPRDAYGFTKAEAERIVLAAQSRDLAVVILRPAAILSMDPRSSWGPAAIERARAGEGAFLTSPELAYVHVDDVVDAIVLAAESRAARGRTYNVVGGSGDTREYLDAIHRAAGRPAPPMSRQGPSFRYPTDRIRRELGWAPRDRWRGFLDELARHGAP